MADPGLVPLHGFRAVIGEVRAAARDFALPIPSPAMRHSASATTTSATKAVSRSMYRWCSTSVIAVPAES